jgi:superoxide reductase
MAENQEEIHSIADLDSATDYELKHTPNLRVVDHPDNQVMFVTIGLNGLSHPQTEEHFIEWIRLYIGDELFYDIHFDANDTPEDSVDVPRVDELIRIQARCNLHGIWETLY